jgi:hypothetical protein
MFFEKIFFFVIFTNKIKILFATKGSNDSNYSGPSSGGDLSYEENDKNLINKHGGDLNSRITSDPQANRHRSQQVKSQLQQPQQQQQQRNQDAKQEIELCRVI